MSKMNKILKVLVLINLFTVFALFPPSMNTASAKPYQYSQSKKSHLDHGHHPAVHSKHFKFQPPGSLDDRPYPEYDYSRANRLPAEMIGYWEKSFNVDGFIRTAKIYISPETPIRSYYTVIAVPDGVNTAEFLWKAGWVDMANRRGEGLFVLEPGAGGWGSYEEEIAYANAALGFYASNNYFSIFGENYFVGYGKGAPALEAWAVANPLKVISQVYLDSKGLPASYIQQYASLEYGGENGSYGVIEFPDGFEKLTYAETVLPIKDGLPKFKDMPPEFGGSGELMPE